MTEKPSRTDLLVYGGRATSSFCGLREAYCAVFEGGDAACVWISRACSEFGDIKSNLEPFIENGEVFAERLLEWAQGDFDAIAERARAEEENA